MATITHKPANFDACPVFQPPPIARTIGHIPPARSQQTTTGNSPIDHHRGG